MKYLEVRGLIRLLTLLHEQPDLKPYPLRRLCRVGDAAFKDLQRDGWIRVEGLTVVMTEKGKEVLPLVDAIKQGVVDGRERNNASAEVGDPQSHTGTPQEHD